MRRFTIAAALLLAGCSRPIIYKVPVIVPPPAARSSSVTGCIEALARARALNAAYLKELKIRKATVIKPAILAAPGFTEDQYRNSCAVTLTAIGIENYQLHNQIGSVK